MAGSLKLVLEEVESVERWASGVIQEFNLAL
jgi:hypothetical protein